MVSEPKTVGKWIFAEFRMGFLKDELDSLKRKVMTRCDINIVGREVVEAKGKVNMLIDGLRHDTFESYTNIRRNVDQTLLEVGGLLRDLID